MQVKTHFFLKNKKSELNTLALTLESFAQQAKLDTKQQLRLNLVLDELFTNIISYAYDDSDVHEIEIHLRYIMPILTIIVIDSGKAFNPIEQYLRKNWDVESNLEQREIGGLGLYFVQKFVDRMDYQRTNDYNRLTLEKDFSKCSADRK